MNDRVRAFLVFAWALAIPVQAAEFRTLEPAALPFLITPDLNGREHDLAKYKGQVVLINFWASWCPPCKKEMPSMQRLQQKTLGKPFVILAVDSGESRDEAGPFLNEIRPNFAILPDADSEITKHWKVFAMPTSFLVDKRGQVRYALAGATEWDEGDAWRLIQELLAE